MYIYSVYIYSISFCGFAFMPKCVVASVLYTVSGILILSVCLDCRSVCESASVSIECSVAAGEFILECARRPECDGICANTL